MRINFGESVPKHSLILLYWFANTIDIDEWNNMWLTFDVNRGDYGSHRYHNSEHLLDLAPPGYGYYAIGNLYQGEFARLPNYVTSPPGQYAGDNFDRIIVRMKNKQRGRKTIDRVYITQHLCRYQGSSYDPRHTYRITLNLIAQLQTFAVGANQLHLSHLRQQFETRVDDFQMNSIRRQWRDNPELGLLIFIVIEERSLPTHTHTDTDTDADADIDIQQRCLCFGNFLLIIILLLVVLVCCYK